MRYLTAKGLLAGLSVLLCQLRAPLMLIPTGSTDDPAAAAASASSSSRSRPSSPVRRRLLLVLRRRVPIVDASPPKSPPPPPPPPPLLPIARHAAELIEAVVAHPRASPGPSPPSPTNAFAGGRAPPPAPVVAAVAVSRGNVAIEAPAAATISCPTPSAAAAAAAAATVGAASPSSARRAETGGASSPRLGAIRALAPLMSLLAGMVAAELDESPQLRPTSRSPPAVDARKDPRPGQSLAATANAKAGLPETTAATAAAAPLSDGLLRLAYVVVRAANRACPVDLYAMQVCESVRSSLGQRTGDDTRSFFCLFLFAAMGTCDRLFDTLYIDFLARVDVWGKLVESNLGSPRGECRDPSRFFLLHAGQVETVVLFGVL